MLIEGCGKNSKVPYPISDSVWLTNGSLLVGAGHLMFLYGQLTHEYAGPKSKNHTRTLFDYVAHQNGPLLDYHPQMLLQCLLWGAFAFLLANRKL